MEKDQLRRKYIEMRKSLSPEEINHRSEKICEHIFQHFKVIGKKISIFLPITRTSELDTFKILNKAVSLGVEVAIPRTDIQSHSLEMITYEGPEQLELVSFGIPEPKYGEVVSPEEFDFIFVPLLAIDEDGNRVGYGKGIYDRYLKRCSSSCVFVGLFAFKEFAPRIQGVTASDVPMDFVVTPYNVISFNTR